MNCSDANILNQNYPHLQQHKSAKETQEYEFAKEFWQITSLHFGTSYRRRPGGSRQTDGWRILFHKLLNNHTDVVTLCCDWDWDSAIADVDVCLEQPLWLVDASEKSPLMRKIKGLVFRSVIFVFCVKVLMTNQQVEKYYWCVKYSHKKNAPSV